MSVSSGSRRSGGSSTRVSVSLSKSDYLFLLSWRGKVVKTSATLAELNEMLVVATREELDLLEHFKNEDRAFINHLTEQGWFSKTYESVQHYVKTYLREHLPVFPHYNCPHSTSKTQTNAAMITKMLKFYHMKGIAIPLEHVNLTDEQLAIMPRRNDNRNDTSFEGDVESSTPSVPNERVIVINSGPGTGKTTGAIHLSKALMDEGVICVAYTNAAVEHFLRSLRAIVNDVRKVDDKMRRSKEDTDVEPPKIYVCTIDKLASNFLTFKGVKEDDFDQRIVMATSNLDRNDKFFFGKDGKNIFNHIIIDEAQDLTRERHEFIMRMFDIIKMNQLEVQKTVAFFGDPRQRLTARAGQEFQRLLSLAPLSSDSQTSDTTEVFNFTKTFRFQNKALLDLCNELSAVRLDIHVPLVSARPMNTNRPVKVFSKVGEIGETIIAMVKEQGILPHQICIITPAPRQPSCRGTKETKEIINMIASQNIGTSPEWKEDCVLYTSIHAIKGLEYDYVFFVGVAGFPRGFEKVYEANDAVSINFVANTRAKIGMFYLSDKTFQLPLNIPPHLTENGKTAVRYTAQYQPRDAIRSDEIEEGDYRKFETSNTFFAASAACLAGGNTKRSTNEFKLMTREVKRLDRTPVPLTYETISAILSVVNGQTIPRKHDDITQTDTKELQKHRRATSVFDMTTADPMDPLAIKGVYIAESDEGLYQELMDTYPVEHLTMHQKYHLLIKGYESQLTDMKVINYNVMFLASLLESTDMDRVRPYHSVVGARIRASCIISERSILVFSSSLHLCSYVKRLSQGKKVFSISSSNLVTEVVLAPYQVYRYKYYIDVLFTITCQKHLINVKASSDAFLKPTFFVDTEFLTIKENKRKTIYDIAIVNGVDPYQSIVTLVDCGPEVFERVKSSAFNTPVPFGYVDFTGSPTIEQVFDKFCSLLSQYSERAELYSYGVSAKHDTAWITEMLEPNEDSGVDMIEASGLAGGGKLDIAYDRIMASKCSNFTHIIRHSAIGDTVLLWELVKAVLHPL
jgi:hypothetical protein